MKKNSIAFFIVLFWICSLTHAQQLVNKNIGDYFYDYSLGLTTEFQMLSYQSTSLGFGIIQTPQHYDKHGKGLIFNNEITFKNAKDELIYSPQISIFYTYILLYGGVKFSYYSNFKESSNFVLSPEIGIGYYLIFITYGRNLIFSKTNNIPVNNNNISLKIIFPLEDVFGSSKFIIK